MHPVENSDRRQTRHGFTLPVVLAVTTALLVLAIGLLAVTRIDRHSARSHVDLQRADLAARAGLEEIKSILLTETANDDFLVIQSHEEEAAPHLFIARGRHGENGPTFHYTPLFSASGKPPETSTLKSPDPAQTVPESPAVFTTLPFLDPARVSWLPITDEKGRIVSRYAFWVEDLQGKLDATTAGNTKGPGKSHHRAAHPFTAPGLNPEPESDREPALDQIALHAIHPDSSSAEQAPFQESLIDGRPLLVSPDSVLAAAEIDPPFTRDADGRLLDPTARAIEENLAARHQSYLEQPLIPCSPGIDAKAIGKPKLNLNALLAMDGNQAVDTMAAHIAGALPDFESRKGGFPDDYLKTLAANAIDHADEDDASTSVDGSHRGLDAFPLVSEIILQIQYQGIANRDGRKILKFRFRQFTELWNMTNFPVRGEARVSYEVSLPIDSIGAGVGGEPFDSPYILEDPDSATHNMPLTRIGDKYWSQAFPIDLQPNHHHYLKTADVSYTMDIGASDFYYPGDYPFSLKEEEGASGISLMWNGQVVDRNDRIIRQEGLVFSVNKDDKVIGGFKVGTPRYAGKAALPGHVYEVSWPNMRYNMGDPRMSQYLRETPLAENAYPQNISPNRRNIRRKIYLADAPEKPKTFARVLPSEWPDGGHNSAVGDWNPGTSDATDLTAHTFTPPSGTAQLAPHFISNAGRYYSATELGRIHDPIMWRPTFEKAADTTQLIDKGLMPASQSRWPDVRHASPADASFGGGNTLRIGRPEHEAFDLPGKRAAHLLDLFHAGQSRSDAKTKREGPVTHIEGHLNLNTATRDTIRALAAGKLVMDPALSMAESRTHVITDLMAPATEPLVLFPPTSETEADRIADAIIRCRPFSAGSQVAHVTEADGTKVFGNRDLHPQKDHIQWSDAAAEELFARVYESSTLRSRNFRVWVIGQAVSPTSNPDKPEVLSESRRVFTLFTDPGERKSDGSINPSNTRIRVLHENQF